MADLGEGLEKSGEREGKLAEKGGRNVGKREAGEYGGVMQYYIVQYKIE